MIYKDFQGERISQLAMGTMRLPLASEDNSDIDAEHAAKMLAIALDQGVNYIDTAYGYHNGESERVMGRLLAEYPRESFNLASKFPGYDSANWEYVRERFEEQLEKCQVDYFDFYLVHNVNEMNIDAYLDDAKYGIVTYLKEQRDAGRIRHLGFSVHGSQDVLERFLDAYGDDMEFCQVQLNWMDWDFQDAKLKVERLREMGIPVWVMEPLRGGKLAELPPEQMEELEALRPGASAVEWAFRYLQSIPGVTTVLSGASSLDQMRENLGIFAEEKPLDPEEMAALDKVARVLTDDSLPCTACRYCTEYCPQELDIPRLIWLYNQRRLTGKGDFISSMNIGTLPDDKKPSACIGCHSCEAACPQQIEIADAMADFAELLEEK